MFDYVEKNKNPLTTFIYLILIQVLSDVLKSYVEFLENDNDYLSDLYIEKNVNKNNMFLCYIYSYNIVVILPIKNIEIYIIYLYVPV